MDSVFDDRKYAIQEAQKMDQSTRYAGVRVIEENYNERTNEATSRTLFRGGAAKSDNAGTKVISTPQSAPRGGTEGESKGAYRGRHEAKKTSFLVPVLILMIVVLGGLAALFGLQQFSSLK